MLHQNLVAAGLPCAVAARLKGRALGAEESSATRDSQTGLLPVHLDHCFKNKKMPAYEHSDHKGRGREHNSTAWEFRSKSVSLLLGKPQAAGVSSAIIPHWPESCRPDLKFRITCLSGRCQIDIFRQLRLFPLVSRPAS